MKVRVQLDFRPEEAQALDTLKTRFGLRSRSDAVRAALGVAGWVVDAKLRGNAVMAVGRDSLIELNVPLTVGVAANAPLK
jgi:hypothetical protein